MRTAAFCVKVDDDVVEALAHSASCALTKSSIDLLVADGNRFFNFSGGNFPGYLWDKPDAVLVDRSILFLKLGVACPMCNGEGALSFSTRSGLTAIVFVCTECMGKGTAL